MELGLHFFFYSLIEMYLTYNFTYSGTQFDEIGQYYYLQKHHHNQDHAPIHPLHILLPLPTCPVLPSLGNHGPAVYGLDSDFLEFM